MGLDSSSAPTKILMGPISAGGFGCGGNPALGRAACQESLPEIMGALEGADIVFIAAGLGAGTGSGAAPLLAETLRKLDRPPVIVAAVTLPFGFESARQALAEKVLMQLVSVCDKVMAVRNGKWQEFQPGAGITDSRREADDIL
jgi:cell division protein FtsZ